jgi:hypothetical protein
MANTLSTWWATVAKVGRKALIVSIQVVVVVVALLVLWGLGTDFVNYLRTPAVQPCQNMTASQGQAVCGDNGP